MVSSMAVIRHEIPRLQADVENGQQILLVWITLAASASKIWLPTISRLKVLAEAWKLKQRNAIVIQAWIRRWTARKHLCNWIVVDSRLVFVKPGFVLVVFVDHISLKDCLETMGGGGPKVLNRRIKIESRHKPANVD